MAKDFKQELTELINKHGLEKEMRDTPDYILAEICIDAMAVYTEAIARRDDGTDSEMQMRKIQRRNKSPKAKLIVQNVNFV